MPEFLCKVKSRRRIFDDTKQGIVYEVKMQAKQGKASEVLYEQVDVTLKKGDKMLYDQFSDGELVKVTLTPTSRKLEEFTDEP